MAVLFSHDALAGSVAPDSQPVLYPTRFYLPPAPPPAEPALIAAAASAFSRRERPVVIAGNGVRIAQAYDQLRDLAEAAGLPVATTAAGKGCFPETHPLALGVFGTFGTAAANACLGEADLVLVVGSKLSPSDTAWENTSCSTRPGRFLCRSISSRATPRGTSRPRWSCSAMRRRFCGSSCDAVGARGYGRRAAAERRVAAYRDENGYFNAPEYRADDQPILPQRVIGELMRNLPDDAIVTCDAGENRIMMTHCYQTKAAGGFLQAAGSGPMGFGIPAALAAKLVHPTGRSLRCRRWRVRDDDERADDRARTRHSDRRRGVQQQGARLGVARLRAVRRRVQGIRPRRDRPRDGLPRRRGSRIRRRSPRRCTRRWRRACRRVIDVMTSLAVSFADITSPLANEASPRRR